MVATGYNAKPLERLTCLVLPAADEPFLVVPELERAEAHASPAGGLGIEITGRGETEAPYALVAARLPRGTVRVAVENHMWAEKAAAFRNRAARRPAGTRRAGARRAADPQDPS
ncbi:hypothetical protein GCM10023079_37940 [Streptomyces chitinivorans]